MSEMTASVHVTACTAGLAVAVRQSEVSPDVVTVWVTDQRNVLSSLSLSLSLSQAAELRDALAAVLPVTV